MIENQNVGNDAQSGAGGTPSQPVSQQAQTPIDGNVTQLLTGFGEKFESLEKQLRGLQGRQDKAENNFQQQLARFNQIKTQGNLSDEQAMEVMQKGDAEAQRWQTLEKKLDDLATKFAGVGTQANSQQQSVATVFAAVGLDPKDPRVAAALVRSYPDQASMELTAKALAWDLAQSPNPTPAQGASLQGGSVGANDLNAKLTRLQELQQRPSQNMKEIAELTKELDARGWK